mmetsp:Transcript_14858/g.44897  ORF Transcript_14858/g.44897 Transcript_14858/m.44897 type:complete len:244 (+) Transcript_14858:671-1402(+)
MVTEHSCAAIMPGSFLAYSAVDAPAALSCAPEQRRWLAASGVAGNEVGDVGQLEQTCGSHHVVEHVVVRKTDAPVMPRVPEESNSCNAVQGQLNAEVERVYLPAEHGDDGNGAHGEGCHPRSWREEGPAHQQSAHPYHRLRHMPVLDCHEGGEGVGDDEGHDAQVVRLLQVVVVREHVAQCAQQVRCRRRRAEQRHGLHRLPRPSRRHHRCNEEEDPGHTMRPDVDALVRVSQSTVMPWLVRM